MGKGDKKTKRGKIKASSYGNMRMRKDKISEFEQQILVGRENRLNATKHLKHLYLLHQVLDGKLKKNTSKNGDESLLLQLNLLQDKILSIQKNHLQFTASEVYSIYGRYDLFLNFHFHYLSESYDKYGESVMGTPKYSFEERAEMNKSVGWKKVKRENTVIKIEASEVNNISKELKKELLDVGLFSKDIIGITPLAGVIKDKYKKKKFEKLQKGIEIKVQNVDTSLFFASIMVYKKRIDSNEYPLTHFEFDKYFSLLLILNPDSISQEDTERYILTKDKVKKTIKFEVYKLKNNLNIELSETEKEDYKELTNSKFKQHMKLVLDELEKSTKLNFQRQSDKREIVLKNLDTITQMILELMGFQPINLSTYGSKFSVRLEEKGFVHVLMRHHPKFQVEDYANGEKSTFRYTVSDTLLTIKKVIQELQIKIDSRLSTGQDFRIRKFDSQYYNGDFFSVHVDNSGLLMAFNPYDEKA